ncbi:hypothetical protein RC083_02755 [Pseudoalteromonas haloplanktis]|uniref:Uncharacterized protein n=1 Tax=Pseudoalteromonas haloplanktis TaxID=228 RepID=A0ABU1BAF9_PSEHA|nr:hypothetical protein [Pseudoalteromonas haloplanktis]MDQ9090509.1 hypothetical protein [Pseudoalteromonas haloplanktis]
MLMAILNNKAGRIENAQGDAVSWREIFKAYEDLLTSTFFERFSYLDQRSQMTILAKCFDKDKLFLSSALGELEKIEYWPRFALINDQQSLVEPDVILCFKKVNILIEVKPPSGGEQYFEQWSREVRGLSNSHFKDKPLYFLALGGVSKGEINQQLEKLVNDFELLKYAAAKNWHELVPTLKELFVTSELREQRVVKDMIAALGLYNVSIQDFKWKDLALASFKTITLNHEYLSARARLKIDNDLKFENFSKANFQPLSLNSMTKWKLN